MVRNKLDELKQEIAKYIGIPYFSNVGKFKNNHENVFVGKGTAKEIALKTIELANKENLKLVNLTPQQIYNFQKKHHLGIDCSGLACHLLNFYFHTSLNARKTSADMLTSFPFSVPVDLNSAQTGDLIRQKNGHHLLFITEKIGNIIYYIDSSSAGRGVNYGHFDSTNTNFPNNGFFRLQKTS
jgi:hypothetical protein